MGPTYRRIWRGGRDAEAGPEVGTGQGRKGQDLNRRLEEVLFLPLAICPSSCPLRDLPQGLKGALFKGQDLNRRMKEVQAGAG